MQSKKKEIKFEQPSELLSFTNRYLLLILFFLVAGTLTSSYFFLLNPKIESMVAVREKDDETEESRKLNEQLLGMIKDLEAEYKSIKENRSNDLTRMKNILPSEPQIAELFVLADDLASKHSFRLLSINISEKGESMSDRQASQSEEIGEVVKTGSTSIKSLAVNLSLEGRGGGNQNVLYNNFKAYLDSLQKNLRLMDIQSIYFSGLTTGNNLSAIFNLDVITYYR